MSTNQKAALALSLLISQYSSQHDAITNSVPFKTCSLQNIKPDKKANNLNVQQGHVMIY